MAAVPRRSMKVLILDPYEPAASSMEEIFTRAGYDARSTLKDEDALAHALASPPDLAIIELLLLPKTGPEFAIELRKICRACSILFVSALAADFVHQAARDLNCEVLAKPVHPDVLLRAASSLLGQVDVYSSFR